MASRRLSARLAEKRCTRWLTTDMLARSVASSSEASGRPSNSSSPLLGSHSRVMSPSRVDLPQPVGPIRAIFSPGASCSVKPLSTWPWSG